MTSKSVIPIENDLQHIGHENSSTTQRSINNGGVHQKPIKGNEFTIYTSPLPQEKNEKEEETKETC